MERIFVETETKLFNKYGIKTRSALAPGRAKSSYLQSFSFGNFGLIKDNCLELEIEGCPSFRSTRVSDKKIEHMVQTIEILALIPPTVQLETENSIMWNLRCELGDSWIRTLFLAQVFENLTNGEVTFNSYIDLPKSFLLTNLPVESDPSSEYQRILTSHKLQKARRDANLILHGDCQSSEILDFIKSEITEVLEYRKSSKKMQTAESEAILRLCILRVSMNKKIESQPDLKQVQFILYQFARASHIISKMEPLLKKIPENFVPDVSNELEVDLLLNITALDHAFKRLCQSADLGEISNLVGQMIKTSRAFSKFYSKCRVLPGSSGFDGEFKIELTEGSSELAYHRYSIVKMFEKRFSKVFNILHITPIHTM